MWMYKEITIKTYGLWCKQLLFIIYIIIILTVTHVRAILNKDAILKDISHCVTIRFF